MSGGDRKSSVPRDVLDDVARVLAHGGEAGVVARAVDWSSTAIARPLLEQREQIVDLRVPSTGLAIDVDPDRLAQVVANLLTNAAKYSEPATTIHVDASRYGAGVRLRVRDEGIGIAPEMRDKVFDMFFQQSQSLDRSKGGLGLGLAIVRNLIALHEGSVTVASDGVGRGSEFVVELPLAGQSPVPEGLRGDATRSRVSRRAAEPRTGKRILVVDDNADAADSLASLLRMMGHDTVSAHDGREALHLAVAFKPEICLLDIGLPVMDGYELARRLRASPALCDGARLIAVSGYGQASDSERTLRAGFDPHLIKSVELDVLIRAVGD
jgi:CheY-like chemotaxis protein